MSKNVLQTKNLKKLFPIKAFLGKPSEFVHAVDDVSFEIKKGETFGLVGESGCGKTTLGRLVLNLLESTSGDVMFNGKNLNEMSKEEVFEFRRQSGIVFQDPFSSLNPRMMTIDIVAEPLDVHKLAEGKEREEKVIEMLEKVGLKQEHLLRFPHEFSGGQRQRLALARALITNPEFIVMDEPTSALDVSVQAQILNLIKKLQKDLGLTYLFISHDLSVVQFISHRIAVMYLGKTVEVGPAKTLFKNPKHPYTKALFSALPAPDPDTKWEPVELEGEVPTPVNPAPGCRFTSRCPEAMDICAKKEPPLIKIDKDRLTACHLFPDPV